MEYNTLNLLGLQPNDIENLTISRTDDDNIIINVTLSRKSESCPVCGSHHINVKDYQNRNITHSILNNKKMTIHYRSRRLICKDCGKTFTESNPFASPKQRISHDTVMQILKDCKD